MAAFNPRKHMKRLLFSFAAALVSAASFAAVAQSAVRSVPESVRLRVEVDRRVLPADQTERAVLKIALDGVRLPRRDLRPPVNLALVIDRSGSMAGEKLAKAREAALEAVRRLAADDVVSLVVYDDQVETLVPAQRVGDGRRLAQAIGGIEAGGNTALYGGVVRGASEVRRLLEDRRFVNRVILLSDGLANVGPSSPEALGQLGRSLMKEGISVTTIGLGLGYNEDLMTRLAQRSDGNTYFVEDSGDLPRIFAAELGDVLNVVARRIVVEVELPEGVRPVGFVGRDGEISGQKARMSLNQLYGGQEKFALLEVEVAPGAAGREREIARAQVSFNDAVTGRDATLTAGRTVTFSADAADVVSSANHAVQADYAANVLAVAKDEAIALVDANRRAEAAEQLRARSAELNQLAVTYGNAEVQQLAAAAAPEAQKLEREGLDNAARKAYRTDSAQTRNQQGSSNSMGQR
ncbi:VWA domain-containing protein [Horticoccus luteus]|uniref:VWA domain-containing protein n=2 Tax=Horticoccus luteus TaxID=2862869 RepID=A0A8F9XLM1_9BACT|nr:VWA domain-containing protein [Horticoccus luteus]